MADIIEQSETPSGEQIVTVVTDRGDEFIISLDAAACAIADLLSDLDNEIRFGWTLSVGWYDDEVCKLRNRVLKNPIRTEGVT